MTSVAHIWLVGMMGSGKSVVGRKLAKKMGVSFVDLDRKVEGRARASVSAIFRDRGEAAFRALEERELARAASAARASVVATGGGAVLSDVNVARMHSSGRVVWLHASAATLAKRAARQGGTRPLLAGGDTKRILAKILRTRDAHYARAADVSVETETLAPARVAGDVEAALGTPVEVIAGAGRYPIHVGNGLLSRAGALVREATGADRVVVVADAKAGRLHGETLRRSLRAAKIAFSWIPLVAGERNKHVGTVERLWRDLLRAGVDRRTPVLALGGGVLGDLAGFAAATVLRGVPLVQLPTTLVAQVDSAIGGKTGFDLPEGKNLVGAFKHPGAVIVDPAVLATLPARELRAGLAEVVKYGVIADEALFSMLEVCGARPLSKTALELLVWRCVRIKAGVVSRDPEERGERVILNFGHTAGHALEAASGYRVLHGEAVAAGMVAEAELAAELDVCRPADATRLAGLVARLGLPLALPAKGAQRFLASDKKRAGGVVRLPLLKGIGSVEVRDVALPVLQRLFTKQGRKR